MIKLLPICLFCRDTAVTEPDMCYGCNDYDGICFVSKKEWEDDTITFDELKKYNEVGEEYDALSY